MPASYAQASYHAEHAFSCNWPRRFEHHVPKGYVYFSLAFAVCVEMLNIRVRKRTRR